MASPAPTPPQGVYYLPCDSPGFLVRLVIDAIDLAIVALIVITAIAVAWHSFTAESPGRDWTVLAGFIVGWIYLVPLKRSVGTLGYLIFGIQVVDLSGQPPGLLRLTARALIPLVFNPIMDLLFISSDHSRQALRDKINGTYLIIRGAQIAGTGDFVYARLYYFNLNLLVREVKRPE